ncbi:ATP-binding protein [Actinocorallia sp. A-T 12471]|uniref:ATP-binding protein n=1 Tax=Actinocorallia sp. A-T 12471 TaxID=3089813 RepID=UPI0029CFF8CE|nr:tetratricopeptide repeat protein [Actinocorallia sp. A-T 12471]MDX6740848.1 tetratricopeptide repeat protein [Actinocorallia sp. A-T 12471]
MVSSDPPNVVDSGASAAGDFHQRAQFAAGRDNHVGTVHVHQYGADVPGPRAPVALRRRDVRTFVGRHAELAEVRAWLDYQRFPTPLVNVCNGPGSGKTTLAVRAAHQVASSYTGGQLFLELSQAGLPELDAREVLFRMLVQLGVAESRIPASLAARADLFHAELPARTLLVLDSVRSLSQIREVLPGRPDCGVLMTSRRSFSELEGIQEMDLGRMADDEAFALLQERVGAARVDGDPEAAREIVRLCGALPLAIHMAGAQLTKPSNRRMPLARFAGRLASARLDLLRTDHLDLRASFALSYEALSPAAARHFRLLSLLSVPDLSDELALAVAGTDTAEETLGELFDTHLLGSLGEGRARFHDLVKVFAQELALAEDAEAERAAAVDRALDWCVLTATRWGRHIGVDGRRHADDDVYTEALDALSEEHAVLMAAVRQAAETGRDDIPWRIVAQLAGFFEVRGHWADWLEGAELALAGARRLGDPAALGVALYLRAWPLRLTRRQNEAIEDATAAAHLLRDRPEARRTLANTLSHLGTLYRETHRYDEATDCLDQAAAIFREADDAHGEGLVLRTLGHVQFWRRDLEAAEATLRRAVDLLHRVGDKAAEGWSHNNLCSVLGARWRLADARHHHGEALRLFTEIDHPQGRGWAHNHLGRILRQYGEIEAAVGHNETALALFTQIGDAYGRGWALIHLGAALGDAERLEEARRIFADMDVPESDAQGAALVHLARLRADPALTDEAIGHFELVGNLQGIGDALRVRADLALAAGDPAAAARAYDEALVAYRGAHDPHGQARALLGLAELDPTATHAETARALLEGLGLPHP